MVMDKEYRAVLHSFRGPLTDIARHIDKLGQTDDAMAYKVRSEVANIINEARDIIFNLPE